MSISDEQLKEREDYMRQMAKEVWPIVKKRVGITWQVKCPHVAVSRRLMRSKGGRWSGVRLSTTASESVLVHELLHVAMMMMPGAIKETVDGRHIHHSSRMRFLERTICEALGFKVRGWAAGEPYSPYHRARQDALRAAIAHGCWKCKGRVEKSGVIPRVGTILKCTECGYKWFV